VADSIAEVVMLLGALLCLIGALGVLKLPDPFSRMHATSKATTLGLLLVLTGVGVVLHPSGSITKLLIVGAFQLVTTPIAAHLVARASYRAENLSPRIGSVDELAEHLGEPPAPR
jgi:multicomponent Na+:H+ antiporter subunit G